MNVSVMASHWKRGEMLMSLQRSLTSIAVLTLLLLAPTAQASSKCAWSNEGCRVDDDCCSNSCHRAHVGTNYRCRHSHLRERCIFNYHCADKLECRDFNFTCCAPYWQTCRENTDCCESGHQCRRVEGFVYARCLFPSTASTLRSASNAVFLVPLITSLLLLTPRIYYLLLTSQDHVTDR